MSKGFDWEKQLADLINKEGEPIEYGFPNASVNAVSKEKMKDLEPNQMPNLWATLAEEAADQMDQAIHSADFLYQMNRVLNLSARILPPYEDVLVALGIARKLPVTEFPSSMVIDGEMRKKMHLSLAEVADLQRMSMMWAAGYQYAVVEAEQNKAQLSIVGEITNTSEEGVEQQTTTIQFNTEQVEAVLGEDFIRQVNINADYAKNRIEKIVNDAKKGSDSIGD